MQHERLLHQRHVAADEFVDRFLGRRVLDQLLHASLEALGERAFDEDLLARELVDDLVAAARRPPISLAAACARAASRPVTITSSPRFASTPASCFPRPDVPPMMTALP